MSEKRWVLENHLCRSCGGRILRCVAGQGPSAGGNPLWKCADCGKAMTGMGAAVLCWCGFSMRGNRATAYTCVPFSLIKEKPDIAQALINSFRACGCEPDRGEVGIMLEKEYRAALQPAQRTGEAR